MKRTLTLTGSVAALALGAGAALPAAAQTTVEEFCSTFTTPKAINDLQTTTDSIVVDSGVGTIADLDVSVDISHTFVGDLVITLDHAPPGTTTTLLDRPSVSDEHSCGEDNILATFDDEATAAAETMCNADRVLPAIHGHVIGGDPPNTSLLASYDGQDVAGTWTLSVTDQMNGDQGTLNGWCLIAEVSSAPDNQAPDCSAAAPSVATLWPPNQTFHDVEVLGVTDPDDDPVTITIDSIFQDEPVDDGAGGAFVPDGEGVGTDFASLRAERDGAGNGRVYHVAFTADDGMGGTCTGEVLVGVPKSQGKQGSPVDDGALYDSTEVP